MLPVSRIVRAWPELSTRPACLRKGGTVFIAEETLNIQHSTLNGSPVRVEADGNSPSPSEGERAGVRGPCATSRTFVCARAALLPPPPPSPPRRGRGNSNRRLMKSPPLVVQPSVAGPP